MPPEQIMPEPGGVTPDTAEGPAGIYVHIPFCRAKCPYCDFVSYAGTTVALQNRYLQALAVQARTMAAHPWTENRTFHSLYVGGGNPPSVEPEKLAPFIELCLELFPFAATESKPAEVSMEANPNTISLAMLQRYRQAGVNRLSLGMQSFSDRMLKNLGRKHSVRDNLKAFAAARAAGFANINLDLMYGLPGQQAADWQHTLQQAVALSPEHFSVYELTIEAGTPFAEAMARGELALPSEEETLAMFEQAREVLTTHGYSHYEISNYGRRGFVCRHNMNYWQNGSYIGLGAGAVSCLSGVRLKNTEDPAQFIELLNQRTPYSEAEFLPLVARFRETVIMGLRLTGGVSVKRLAERFGLTPQEYYGEMLQNLKNQALLEETAGRLRLTRRGLVLANRVMAQLV